jgi:hypothetical protein
MPYTTHKTTDSKYDTSKKHKHASTLPNYIPRFIKTKTETTEKPLHRVHMHGKPANPQVQIQDQDARQGT